MAKLLGPDFMSLQVRDLAVSRAFYIDLLGFTEDPHFRAPGFVLFDTTTIPFGISEARVNLDEALHLGWGVALWIDCDNVDELYAKLEAAGATILQKPYMGTPEYTAMRERDRQRRLHAAAILSTLPIFRSAGIAAASTASLALPTLRPRAHQPGG